MSAKWTTLAAAVCLVALAAASVGRLQNGSMAKSGEAVSSCSPADTFVPCGTVFQWGAPVGDGLFAITIEDFI
jgi:hypothetical protein